jgi:hypothetical protein
MSLNRRTALLLSALAVLFGTGCSQNSSAENRLRVVDWNLEWFPGGKPDAPPEMKAKQMAAAKRAIVELQPDVLSSPGSSRLVCRRGTFLGHSGAERARGQ